jgi:hypothetical protein
MALGLGLISRNEPAEHSIVLDKGRQSSPLPDAPKIEVASSVAAVLDDLHAEYRVLAEETSTTARELADALPTPNTAPWDTGFSASASPANTDLENSRGTPPGAVSLIGRSFGNQIGQAMDFLRLAVPDEVPRG